jgi:nucleoside 2-deoxyribosyltransferase
MPKVYLAGKMAASAERYAIAPWRTAVAQEVRTKPLQREVLFINPESTGCDHLGVAAQDTVDSDLWLINNADIVLAVIDEGGRDRVGTFVEIGYAAGRGIPVLVLAHEGAHYEGCEAPKDSDERIDWWYKEVIRTNHGCWCVGGEDLGWFWFAIGAADKHSYFSDEYYIPTKARSLLKEWFDDPKPKYRQRGYHTAQLFA